MTTGMTMANDGNEPNNGTTPGTNNRETYESFMTVTKWAVIVVAIALILMAVLLVH